MKARSSMIALMLLSAICVNAYATTSVPTAIKSGANTVQVQSAATEEMEFIADSRIPLSYDLQKYIVEKSNAYGVRPALIYGMIRQESDFNTNCVSDKGRSVGLMQIQRRWHKARMDKVGATDLYNPYDNVATGIDLIAELLGKYNYSEVYALTAYNRGEAGAKRYFRKGYSTSSYAEKVLKYAREYENGSC